MSFGQELGETRWTGRLRWKGIFRRRLQMELETVTGPGRFSHLVTESWVDASEADLSEIHETVASLRKQLGMARIREERQQNPVTTLECRVRPRADMPLTEVEALLVDEMQRQQSGAMGYATGGLIGGLATHRFGEETSEQTRPCQAPPHRNPPDVDSGSLASCVSRHTTSPSDSFQGFPSSSDTSSSTTAD